ncbi:MAG: Phosphoribosyltransferase [Parcubacteria group bacterium GW2011_GWA2_50_10b]|nr:MAG: Phosphoribosyltransferase [Parcubacteria group bacterium GW2011_GWA2_50_10b]
MFYNIMNYMYFFYRLRDFLLDFLFPKSRQVLELEALSVETILKTLPPAAPLSDENLIALFDYSHPWVKEIIWEIKYGGNRILADKLGGILYDTIMAELNEQNVLAKWRSALLVPMPVSDRRRFERGWNQAELLAAAVAGFDRGGLLKYLPRQLAKTRHTESQTRTASRSERMHNLAGSMRVINPLSVEGKFVVLLDDVTTTGSTFAEARRALREAGAKKVLCVAVAH